MNNYSRPSQVSRGKDIENAKYNGWYALFLVNDRPYIDEASAYIFIENAEVRLIDGKVQGMLGNNIRDFICLPGVRIEKVELR